MSAAMYWDAILSHRDELSKKIGREASLQVAALDYFQNLKGAIRIPKILEMSTFLATERSAITRRVSRIVPNGGRSYRLQPSRKVRWRG